MSEVSETQPHWSPLPEEWRRPLPLSSPNARHHMDKIGWPQMQESLAFRQLWLEVALLEKILYKNKSQHRGAAHFKRLQQVVRHLRLLRELSIPKLVEDAAAPFITRRKVLAGQVPRSPSRQAVGFLLCRLFAGCTLAEEIMEAIQPATAQMFAQLAMSYFMPLALSTSAAMARVNVLVASLMAEYITVYNQLAELLPQLPSSAQINSDSASPSATLQMCWTAESAAHLPHMLKCDREGGLSRVRSISFKGTTAVCDLLTPTDTPATGEDDDDVNVRAAEAGRRPIYTFNELEELPVFVDRGPTKTEASMLAQATSDRGGSKDSAPLSQREVATPPTEQAKEAEVVRSEVGEAVADAVPMKPLSLVGRKNWKLKRVGGAAEGTTFLRVNAAQQQKEGKGGADGDGGPLSGSGVDGGSDAAQAAKRQKANSDEDGKPAPAANDIFAALLS